MSPRCWEERINDILNAIAEINSFVENMEFSEFQKDTKTIRAVEFHCYRGSGECSSSDCLG